MKRASGHTLLYGALLERLSNGGWTNVHRVSAWDGAQLSAMFLRVPGFPEEPGRLTYSLGHGPSASSWVAEAAFRVLSLANK